MKKYLFYLLLLIAGKTYAQEIPSVKMDDVLKMIDTSTTPLVINFWASWCPPCVHEIPYFEKQMKQFKNVKLILVSLDFKEDYPEKLQSFVKKHKYQSEILWLSETDANSFCPKLDKKWEGNIPVTLFINRAKNYRHFAGLPLSEKQFRAQLEKL